jgi:hypothetical protein
VDTRLQSRLSRIPEAPGGTPNHDDAALAPGYIVIDFFAAFASLRETRFSTHPQFPVIVNFQKY